MTNYMKKIPFYFLILLVMLSLVFPLVRLYADDPPSGSTGQASGSVNAGANASATSEGAVSSANQDYVVLAPLPGTTKDGCVGDDCTTTLEKYLPGAFNLMVGVAAALAFIMITWGGVMYATSDALSSKTEGKGYIENAVWGLLLVIGAWVILNTINPQILKFDSVLPRAEIRTGPGVTGGGSGGGTSGSVGCQGSCPYSYTNGSTVINYKDCSDCSASNSFGLDIKNKVVNGVDAKMNTELGNSLKGVKETLGSSNSFQVTETWPPTVNHKAQGQYDGTSVDVKLYNPTVANINSFIDTAGAKGLRVVYEVKDEAQRQSLISQGVPAGSIIAVGYITAGHFSVYKK